MDFIKCDVDINYIRDCFSQDDNFVKNIYNIPYKTVDSCVYDTINKLTEKETDFYEVVYNNNFIGFFAFQRFDILLLRTFFIKPKYRTNDIKDKFFMKLKSEFNSFIVTVYNTNKPAIGYLNKNGGIINNIVDNSLFFKF